jgi:hypothetical protein
MRANSAVGKVNSLEQESVLWATSLNSPPEHKKVVRDRAVRHGDRLRPDTATAASVSKGHCAVKERSRTVSADVVTVLRRSHSIQSQSIIS